MSQYIVIIEDAVVTRRRLAALLKREMHRVSDAADAEAMKEIVARDPADGCCQTASNWSLLGQ